MSKQICITFPKKLIYVCAVFAVVAVIALVLCITQIVTPANKYKAAEKLLEEGNVAEAAIRFGELGDYEDARYRSLKLWEEVAARDVISAGSQHVVAIKEDGTVVASGDNSYGQCDVSSWEDIVDVSAGDYHTIGLRDDGTVVAVGDNREGACDVSDWTDIVAVDAGWDYSIGLKSNGTVIVAGDYHIQSSVSGWVDIIAVSTNNYSEIIGLRADGTIESTFSRHTHATTPRDEMYDWSNVIAISASNEVILVLKSGGTVGCIADPVDHDFECSDWTNITAVCAGNDHVVGLCSDGTVVTTGSNEYGQCDVSEWTDIVAISAGPVYTIGLKSDGTVVITGDNDLSSWQDIRLPNAE